MLFFWMHRLVPKSCEPKTARLARSAETCPNTIIAYGPERCQN